MKRVKKLTIHLLELRFFVNFLPEKMVPNETIFDPLLSIYEAN